DIARTIHRDALRVEEGGRVGGTAVSGARRNVAPGQRGDDARRVHFADAQVGDEVEIARRIQRERGGSDDLRAGGGAVVSRVAHAAVAREEGEGCAAVQFIDGVEGADVEVSRAIRGQRGWTERSVDRGWA